MQTFLLIKSLGDALIPFTCLSPEDECKFIVGSHLCPLINELNLKQRYNIDTIYTGDATPFPLYNIRNTSFNPMILKTLKLRRKIKRIIPRPITSEYTWREKVLGLQDFNQIDSENIYKFYSNFKKINRKDNVSTCTVDCTQKIALLPFTRQKSKNISKENLYAILDYAEATNKKLVHVRFADEPQLLGFVHEDAIIKKSIKSLSNKMLEFDLAFCADSFPLHLREFLKLRSFGIYNKFNPYWMPTSLSNDSLYTVGQTTREELFRKLG